MATPWVVVVKPASDRPRPPSLSSFAGLHVLPPSAVPEKKSAKEGLAMTTVAAEATMAVHGGEEQGAAHEPGDGFA